MHFLSKFFPPVLQAGSGRAAWKKGPVGLQIFCQESSLLVQSFFPERLGPPSELGTRRNHYKVQMTLPVVRCNASLEVDTVSTGNAVCPSRLVTK